MLVVCPPPQLVKVDGSLELNQEFGLKWVDIGQVQSFVVKLNLSQSLQDTMILRSYQYG